MPSGGKDTGFIRVSGYLFCTLEALGRAHLPFGAVFIRVLESCVKLFLRFGNSHFTSGFIGFSYFCEKCEIIKKHKKVVPEGAPAALFETLWCYAGYALDDKGPS